LELGLAFGRPTMAQTHDASGVFTPPRMVAFGLENGVFCGLAWLQRFPILKGTQSHDALRVDVGGSC